MACATRFVCSSCQDEVIAWDDGDPYYYDEKSVKQYAWHPDPARNKCIGVEIPHLCLGCGAEVKVDSNNPVDACPQCRSRGLVATTKLQGKPCPKCKKGTYIADPGMYAIS